MLYRALLHRIILCGALFTLCNSIVAVCVENTQNATDRHSISQPVLQQPKRFVRQGGKMSADTKGDSRLGLQVFAGQAQVHSALGAASSGIFIRGYESHDGGTGAKATYWQSSTDNGTSWSTPISFTSGAAYPSTAYWGTGSTFFGTVVSPNSFFSGAGVILMEFDTAASPTSWKAWWTDFADNGWRDMSMTAIASENSTQSWNWGFISLVMDYSDPQQDIFNAPHIYSQINSSGQIQLSWYPQFPGCVTTAAAIDSATDRTYAVYDRHDPANNQWQLFIRQDHFDDWFQPTNAAILKYTDTTRHLRYPTIIASHDTVLLAVMTYSSIDSTNSDIICWGTYIGNPDSLHYLSTIAGTPGRETFPMIRHLQGPQYICTFIRNASLYAAISCDAGLSWSSPIMISAPGEIVIDEYRAVSISDRGEKACWEYVSGTDTLLHDADLGCLDVDGDGVCFCDDNCPFVSNPDQSDADDNGIGDACSPLCGDANGDWHINIGDAVYLINFIFKLGPAPVSTYAGDPNADGRVNIGDAVYLINYIFKSGSSPCHL